MKYHYNKIQFILCYSEYKNIKKNYGIPQEDRRGKHATRPNGSRVVKEEVVRAIKVPRYKNYYTRKYN